MESRIGFGLSSGSLGTLRVIPRCEWLPHESDHGEQERDEHADYHEPGTLDTNDPGSSLFLQDCDASLDG